MADWIAADWDAPPGVCAGVSLRTGGASEGPFASLNLGAHVGDAADSVAENRRRLRAQSGAPAEPGWLRQVHGTGVVSLPGKSVPEADAAVTREPGVVCAVLTADCLPVVLARRDGRAVGVAHAGWRGLAAGVLEATVAALGGGELVAWFGPAISQPAFEVGDEVRAAFVAQDPASSACFETNAAGRWQADLYGLARRRLRHAGVFEVGGGGHCTYAERERFFSYRRDGQCGRMATLVWRDGAAG